MKRRKKQTPERTEERWTEVPVSINNSAFFWFRNEFIICKRSSRILWPIMDISDVVGAAFLPTDGQANPSDITQALAKGARSQGAIVIEEVEVLDLIKDNDQIKGLKTSQGDISCEKVICCAGQWTRTFAEKFGINVPLVPFQHQYLVTEKIEGVQSNLPTLRDPDRLIYFKEEVGGLVMGGYESNPKSWAEEGIPKDFHYTLLDSDFDHFEELMTNALGRVPLLETPE